MDAVLNAAAEAGVAADPVAEELAAKQGDAAERDSETDDEDIDLAAIAAALALAGIGAAIFFLVSW